MKGRGIVIRRRVSLSGIAEAARRVKCSPTHLSLVLSGKRESKRLMARLRDAGIKVEGEGK